MSTPAPASGLSARDRSFRRKVFYLAASIPLFMLQFWLSHPATHSTEAGKGRPGGKLAMLREEYRLNQTDLGQIDPTSETIRLATLGMRGVAVSLLWHKAIDFQMKKDWTSLRATLEQISRMQPHSTSVWRYQAWNLSYNVSVAFDDYRDKYYWIIEGIKFMMRGVELNEHESKLPWDVGWFIAHKIGKADEAKPFRRLFKVDDRFPADTADGRDNWKVGKTWFQKAEMCINERHPVKAMAPVIFYSDAPMCQFYFSEALENDGHFGENAVQAWKGAQVEWANFGDREVPTSWDISMRMNDQEAYEAKARDLLAALDKMSPGLRDKIKKEKYDRLSDVERKALETLPEKRSPDQNKIVAEIQSQLEVTHEEVARRVSSSSDERKKARKLADEATHYEDLAKKIHAERQKVNFVYWRMRAAMEQEPEVVSARKAFYEADEMYAKGDLRSRESYEASFKSWRKVVDRHPELLEDVIVRSDLIDCYKHYRRCMRQRNEPIPSPFILQDVLDKDPGMQAEAAQRAAQKAKQSDQPAKN